MKKVLVDDHALFRDGVSSLLLAWGHEVADASGEIDQAIELVEAESPADVLMDVHMRGPASRAAAVRMPSDEVAVVVLTVSREEADLFRAIKAGAQGHLPPTLEAPRLRSMLEGVARSASPAPPRSRRARTASDSPADPDGASEGLQRLTERELEVLGLVAEGLRNREIAGEMGISENTVKFHLKNVAEKLHAGNRAELAARAVRGGLTAEIGRGRAARARRLPSAGHSRFDYL
jgi:DNA-binding NarL/FixJ family response regulator